MKKFSPAMSVIVGLFMLFAGIYSVYGGGKTAVIVKQVKVGGGPRLPIGKYPARIL